MLYEELSRKFGCQVVEPFKEPVIIVDAKEFKPQWEEQLKAEGCKILVSDFLGRSCFLIRKPQASNNSASEQPTPSQPQNIAEAIIGLMMQGKNFKEIKESLGLTHAQLMGYLSNLKRRGVLDKIGWTPKRKRKVSTREAKVEPAKPSLNTSNLPIREMLEASLMLLDSHPKVVRFLLQKCMESLP
jgi:hypothetical protein